VGHTAHLKATHVTVRQPNADPVRGVRSVRWPPRLTADAEHVDGGLVQLDEDAVVDLTQPKELEDLADLGRDLVDTADAHHEGQFGLPEHVEVALLLGLSLQPEQNLILKTKTRLIITKKTQYLPGTQDFVSYSTLKVLWEQKCRGKSVQIFSLEWSRQHEFPRIRNVS
jgi:hypothetical protein